MHPNKRKGDRAEIAARNYLTTIFPGAVTRTRAGFDKDIGDIIIETPRGILTVQVKDVATPQWKTWFKQLDQQTTNAAEHTGKPVIGGIILWKTRGKANPAEWRAITTLAQLPQLIGQP